MTVLPDSFDNYEWGVTRDTPKNLHAVFLAFDETVTFDRVNRMASFDSNSQASGSICNRLLGPQLRRPGLLIGRKPQVAVRDNDAGLVHIISLTLFAMLMYR
jgi:hypothetical protein